MNPRSVRNLNPGNVRPRSAGPWPGQVGLDLAEGGPFARFGRAVDGFDCLASLLISYETHGERSVRAIIGVWAPPADHNDTGSYAASVSSGLKVGVDAQLDLRSPAVLHALATAIARVEAGAGTWWKDADMVAGIAAALVRVGAANPAAIAGGKGQVAPLRPAAPAPKTAAGARPIIASEIGGQPSADELDDRYN